MEELRAKKEKESDCKISVIEQSRLDAYRKYFGIEPRDYENHDFSKWVTAPKYLDKYFYALLSEENFDEENKPDGSNYLRRNATGSGPYTCLSDYTSQSPRVVSWVNLVGPPNPSEKFILRLVSSLEQAWGESIKKNGDSAWYWENSQYAAKLKYEPTSPTGSFLSLVVEKK